MKLRRVSGKEIADNHFNIILINSYSVILAVVYGYWFYVCEFKIVFTLLAIIGFVVLGLLFSWLSTIKSGNQKKVASEETKEEVIEETIETKEEDKKDLQK